MKFHTLFVVVPVIIAMVIFMPLIVMWCVDTIFGTNIPINLKTWFATLLLMSLVNVDAKLSKD